MNKLYFNCPYGLIPKNVMKDNSISLGAKGLFAYICAYAGNEDHSFPGRDLITHELNISKDTFTKYMKELKDSKYIHVTQNKEQGKFANNIYYITPDRIEPYTNFSDTRDKDNTNNNITSNNITSNNNNKCAKENNEVVERLWKLYPRKQGKFTEAKVMKVIKEIGEDHLERCIIRYAEECKKENKEKRFILMGSTFINGRYIEYTDENYNEGKEHLKRKEIPSFNANTNQKESINHNQGYGF